MGRLKVSFPLWHDPHLFLLLADISDSRWSQSVSTYIARRDDSLPEIEFYLTQTCQEVPGILCMFNHHLVVRAVCGSHRIAQNGLGTYKRGEFVLVQLCRLPLVHAITSIGPISTNRQTQAGQWAAVDAGAD
jgi:hypothetical protein